VNSCSFHNQRVAQLFRDVLFSRLVLLNGMSGSFMRSLGSKGSSAGQFNFPRSIKAVTIGTEQQLIVADTGNSCRFCRPPFSLSPGNHRVQVLRASDGVCLRAFGSKGSSNGNFSSPFGVALDRNGDVVVADTENHRVQVLRFSDGACLRTIGSRGSGNGQFESPRDVAVDLNGRIIVTDAGNNRLQFFN
jgi:DNA-binding beta-propeller fold protein YncE